NGWRLDLYTTSSDGADEVHGNADDEISDITREKNLGSSVTINGVVYMTSYKPVVDTNMCTLQPGTSYVYQMGLHSANATADMNSDSTVNLSDRKTQINLVGIPSTPGLHFGSDEGISVIPNDVFGGGGEAYTKIFYWFRSSE
ncbi:MAG: hypothetical protein GY694_20860, partial [Gammaproteobacteria bacterium]|nr:hypothetical protein [Gammaproteobacteria bacterium]